MFKYYNAHPKGKVVGDCVKRAISKTADIDYMEVQRMLNQYKKVSGAKVFNDLHKNVEPIIENTLNGRKMSFPAVKGQPRMNGERFCEAYPKGKFILQMANHLTACVDGVIYDIWDCSEKCVYKAWELPSNDDTEEYVIDCGGLQPVNYILQGGAEE